ncbi:hypothetical protein PMAYCL1PPCAC_13368, partial [Pristionchus mayeri]
IQIIQLSIKLTAKNPCEMQFDMRFCFIRILTSFAFPSFVCLHASITVQRIVTSFSGNSKLHHFVARCCLVLTIILCLCYTVLGYRDYPLDGIAAFCPGYTKSNTGVSERKWSAKIDIGENEFCQVDCRTLDSFQPLVLVSFFMMIIDLLNVIITFILIRYNRRKIRDIYSSTSSLAVKFRHRQTLHSIQQLLPVAFFHLLCFTVQYVGFQIGLSLPIPEVDYAALNGFIYMMPYYCLISPSILLLLMTIEEKNKRIELRSLSNITPEATAELLLSIASIIVVVYTVVFKLHKSWFEGVFKV